MSTVDCMISGVVCGEIPEVEVGYVMKAEHSSSSMISMLSLVSTIKYGDACIVSNL